MSKRKVQTLKRASYGEELAARKEEQEFWRAQCAHVWAAVNEPQTVDFSVVRVGSGQFEVYP